ncbi:hydroxyacylglutathione hydrolase [Oceanomicrobium pacificus]|uniref:Hydroxyacylglutathione hydrolase n=1 Tax=Oceanomicrobium pacificus TaxID=2692916 RepID=A0A6B0TIK2_9RHOB|nr:hydroxyacylglutathione hydrolase [Oceanomicrobium pacificus]MXU64250.1 hydroxyacylglutathione hydrolase [Oceanomicrobium pacificus]
MPLEIVTIPCLEDNYAYLAHDPGTGTTALVDAPEAGPIKAELDARDWTLDLVLLTHHHWDHVDGLPELRDAYSPKVAGCKADADRLPPLDIALADGDEIAIGSETGTVIDVSGHTINHVAFHFPGSKVVFTADSLMAMGCGAVFEGTMAQMWASLAKLAALPDDTLVCSGHEYTQNNARFAVTVDPENAALKTRVAEIDAARAQGTPTVPSLLGLERATNPFLRAVAPEVKAYLGMPDASDADAFAEIRTRKNNF